MIAFFNKRLNELQDTIEVKLLLFFFLPLKGALGAIDILLSDDSSLFSLMAVPSADVLDGLDGGELAVVDVDIVCDSHKGLMHVHNGVKLHSVGLDTGLVELSDLLVEFCDFWVEEDHCYDLKGDQC